MWVVTYFDTGWGPATGLFPMVRIRDVEDGSVVASGTMSEKGDGFYAYDFVGYDITKDYTVFCDSITLPTGKRYKYLATGEYGDIINTVDLISDNVEIRALLVRKIMTNKMDLNDGGTDNWILYDDDNASELLKWDVTDKTDDDIHQIDHEVSGRTKGG